MSDALIIDKAAGYWTFTLNRPEKRNALSASLVESIQRGLDAAHTERVPLLVFRGNGSNFSSGFDFTGHESLSDGDLLLRFVRIEQMLQQILDLPAVTLGLAHGRNLGAGVDLLAACQLRWCLPGTTFRMPGLLFGLVLGARRFGCIVGQAEATRILTTTQTFNADDAQRIGFVQRIVGADNLSALLNKAIAQAAMLDADTREQLYPVLATRMADADLAALVRSAAFPGIKDRIVHYLG